MSDKINEQTEKMREMAQTTLDKAKEAVSKYMAESQKLREKADSSVRATYSTAKEMNEKAVAFAEANVQAGFELAERLLQAKNPLDGHHLSKPSEGTDGKDECAVPRTWEHDQQARAGRFGQVAIRSQNVLALPCTG
jgi:hypothetical protein